MRFKKFAAFFILAATLTAGTSFAKSSTVIEAPRPVVPPPSPPVRYRPVVPVAPQQPQVLPRPVPRPEPRPLPRPVPKPVPPRPVPPTPIPPRPAPSVRPDGRTHYPEVRPVPPAPRPMRPLTPEERNRLRIEEAERRDRARREQERWERERREMMRRGYYY